MARVGEFLCGLDAAVAVVGGKWKPLILWALSERPRRTAELRRELEGVSEKVLIAQLRDLERDGIVRREVFPQVPPKVLYHLTGVGEELNRALLPLGDWGERHMSALRGDAGHRGDGRPDGRRDPAAAVGRSGRGASGEARAR